MANMNSLDMSAEHGISIGTEQIQMPATRRVNLDVGKVGTVNLLMPDPSNPDWTGKPLYSEQDQDGGKILVLTETGQEAQQIALKNWESVYDPNKTLTQNTKAVNQVIAILRKDPNLKGSEEFADMMEITLREGIAQVRDAQLEGVKSEIENKESPWGKAVSKMQEVLYPGKSEKFVRNFSASWVAKLRDKITERTRDLPKAISPDDVEDQVAQAITKYLSSATPEQIETIRESKMQDKNANILNILLNKALAADEAQVVRETARLTRRQVLKGAVALAGSALLYSLLGPEPGRTSASQAPSTEPPVPAGPPAGSEAAATFIEEKALPSPQSTKTTGTDSEMAQINNEYLRPPDDQKNPGFMIGSISLEKGITIEVPENLAKFSGRERGFVIEDLVTRPEFGERETTEDVNFFNNEPKTKPAKEVRTVLIRRVNVDRVETHNLMVGHSDRGIDGNVLPFDWIDKLAKRYKNKPEVLRGLTFGLSQSRAEGKVKQEVEIVDLRTISTKKYLKQSFAIGTDNNKPIFFARVDEYGLGLPPDATGENYLTLATCSGDYSGGQHTERALLTVKLKNETITSRPQPFIP